MTKKETKEKKIKIIVKVSPDFYWIEDFESKDFTYDKIDSVRRDAIEALSKGMEKKDIRLRIETELVLEN